MPYADIFLQKEDSLAIITLNRPATLNAFRYQTLEEITTALDEIAGDDTVGVVIITGAPRPDGRPCFSSGADLKERAKQGARPRLRRQGIVGALEGMVALERIEADYLLTFDKIDSFSKPVLAAIDGVCTAGGLELALCCDLIVVSETAQISDLHLKNLGIVGPAGSTVRLTRLVGGAKAKEIILTGDTIDGREAWRIGLANKVVPPSRLMDEAKELGRKIAGMNSDGVRLAMSSIDSAFEMGRHQALRYLYLCAAALGGPKPTESGKRLFETKAQGQSQ